MTFRKTPLTSTRPTRATLHTLSILAILLLAACQHPEKPVTEAEAIEFANKIETSIADRNEQVLDNVLDLKYFAGLVLKQANDRFNYALAMQARAKVANYSLGQTVVAVVSKNGTYELVHHYVREGHQHLLFRLVSESGELNYHDFELVHGDKSVRAIDIYNYGNGEQLSKTVTESLVDKQKASTLTQAERDNNHLIYEASNYLTGGNPEEAWSFFVQLPDSIRRKLPNQHLHIRIAAKLNDSALKAALREYQTNYPQDPFVYLSLFKSDLHAQAYQPALDDLNKFDNFLPADPFLDIYRAFLYKAMNDPLQSRVALERLHAWKPDNFNVIAGLVDNHINAGHSDSAAMLIRVAQAHKIITPQQVEQAKTIYPSLRPYLK